MSVYAEKRRRAAERRAKRKENARFIAATSGRTLVDHNALEARLDDVFSLFIRRRDTLANAGRCVVCNARPIEVCFHWIPRGHHGLRWDEENACGACNYCNNREQKHRGLFRHVFIIIYGEAKRLALEERARQIAQYTTGELQEKLDNFTRRLKGECP